MKRNHWLLLFLVLTFVGYWVNLEGNKTEIGLVIQLSYTVIVMSFVSVFLFKFIRERRINRNLNKQ